MDDFFDRLDARHRVTAAANDAGGPVAGQRQVPDSSGIITGPGYAPAYPPFNVQTGQAILAQ